MPQPVIVGASNRLTAWEVYLPDAGENLPPAAFLRWAALRPASFSEKTQKRRPACRERRTNRLAIYHLEAKVITRSEGRTACGAAAYMSCSRIYNEYDGIQHDYTRKHGLVWEHVFLPSMAPAEWADREKLWNAVEAAEKTKDSRLARELIIALPREFERRQWIGLLSGYIHDNFTSQGMCADVSIHDTDGHNPHAHILLTVRPMDDKGKWQHKTEKEYLCVRDGEEKGFTATEFKSVQAEGWEKQYHYKVGKKKVYMAPSAAEAQGLERISKNPKSTRYGRQNPITERWNSEEQLVLWRETWANAVNHLMEQAQKPERIDHRSHAERGLDEKPTIHEGVAARMMEKAGGISERCELNRQIQSDNTLIRELKKVIEKLTDVVKCKVPLIAKNIEQKRQDIIVYFYGLLHNENRRDMARDFLSRAKPVLKHYTALCKKRKMLTKQHSVLEDQLSTLSFFEIRRRRDLKKQIEEIAEKIGTISEDIQETIRNCGQDGAITMDTLKSDIDEMERVIHEVETQDSELSASIDRAKYEFDEMKGQVPVSEQTELAAAQLSIRPKMEQDALNRIGRSTKSGKINFQNYRVSVSRTDQLLGEIGMSISGRMLKPLHIKQPGYVEER